MNEIKQYYIDHVWDVISCILISAGLIANVFAGYNSPDPKIGNAFLILLFAAVLTVLLFAAGYNKKTTIAGIGTGVFLLLISIIYVRSSGVLNNGGMIDDSPALFWMVVIGTTTVCYLLTRWRIGIIVMMVAGVIMTAAFCFLEYPVSLLGFLLFVAGSIVIFLYRVYRVSLLSSYTGKVMFHKLGAQSTALALAVMLLAGGIYQGIIVPLDPPTKELKLITTLQSFEILEKIGVSRPTEMPLEDNQTQQENEEEQTSNEQTQEDQETDPQEEMDLEMEGDIERETGMVEAMGIKYTQSHLVLYIFIVLLVIALLAAPFVLKRYLKKRWEAKVRSAGATEGSLILFNYLMKKLRYAGYTKPDAVTLAAYMEGQANSLKAFAVGNTDIPALAYDYQRVVYGYQALDSASFDKFWEVYQAFSGNLKKKIGTPKFILRYFMIW